MELTAAEVRKHEQVRSFSACKRPDGTWLASWVHQRGRLDKESDGGALDVVVMEAGGFPRIALGGLQKTSGAIFSPDGGRFVSQNGTSLVFGCCTTLRTAQWLRLPAGESFTGHPVWARDDVVLFGTCGGSPKRARLHATATAPPNLSAGGGSGPGQSSSTVLFAAEHGGGLLSWDHSPTAALVAVVHRKANAMLAEVVLVDGVGAEPKTEPRVVAVDGRVEYCKPQVAFLSDGRLVARLNLAEDEVAAGARLPRVTHGLWLLENPGGAEGSRPTFAPVDLYAEAGLRHGDYDVCSGSYSHQHGAREGFVLDHARSSLAVSARPHVSQLPKTAADELWIVRFDTGVAQRVTTISGKGCHVPVAFNGGTLVYHFRSPTEWGDLWTANVAPPEEPKAVRLTYTMPVSLQSKFITPEEVTIRGSGGDFHALLFRPPHSEGAPQKLQPLVWCHGGPMSLYAFDYNPILPWLASLGYLVCVPNFRGSTGFGVDFMDAVLADGCGVADVSDCFACVTYLRSLADESLDFSRGVGVGGHSWGGYLGFMCMVHGGDASRGGSNESCFSCGIASAGITDWVTQQRFTEVRYYDYALMGGWVYEAEVAERARRASPVNDASALSGPLLVLHGESDIDVPFAQIAPFVEKAKCSSHAGASVTYISYPGEGHGMTGIAAQKDVLKQMRDFLRINLKPWDFTDNPHGDLTAY